MKEKNPSHDQDRERERSWECRLTWEANEARPQEENNPPETRLRGVINMILRGFAGGGSSNLEHKHYVYNLRIVYAVRVEKLPTRSMPLSL